MPESSGSASKLAACFSKEAKSDFAGSESLNLPSDCSSRCPGWKAAISQEQVIVLFSLMIRSNQQIKIGARLSSTDM